MAGTYFELADNAETTLNGNLTDVADSIVVTSVSTLPSTFPYLLTIWDEGIYPDPSDDPSMEIVLVGGATGTTLTSVTRGYGDTAGVAHSDTNRISLLITKEIFTDATYGIHKNIDDAIDDLATHEADTANPHSVTAAQITGAAIKVEYEGEANTNAYTDAEKSKLTGIEPLAKDDQIASEVPNTPAGTIAATDVQAAINELDTEKETPAGAQSKVDTHSALTTGAHGVGSDYVTKTSKPSQIGEFNSTVVVGRSGVVDYLCDGVDDNVQIQAAIDLVDGLGGGSVVIREGTYLFGAKVTISGLSNVEIIGQAGSTIIKQDANITYGSFEIIGDSSNITIRNIIFDNGNNTATSNAHCVVIGESEHVLISDCVFKNVLYYVSENGSDGIYINSRDGGAPAGTLIYDVSIQNCTFLDISRNGVSVIRGERIRIINNYFCVRRSGFDAESNNTDEKIKSVIVNNNFLDGERPLVGVEESGTPETKAFSGDGAGIEFNIRDANLSCDDVVINSNVCIGNGTNGNGLVISKSFNVDISNNVWNGFKGSSGSQFSLLLGNVTGIFTSNTIENYGIYKGVQSYSDSELQISDCLIKEGDGYGIDAQTASIKDCTFIDCGDSTHSVIFNDDTNSALYVDGCTFGVDDKTNIGSVFDLFTSSDFNISAIINNISVVGSAYKSLIKGNANRGVKLVIKNSHFEDCGTLTDNFIHFYSYTGLDSLMVLENNIFKNVLGDVSARTCQHIKINNNLFIDCGKENQNYIIAFECGDVQFQNNYLRDSRSSAKPLYFIQVDSVLGGWTNTTRIISNNQFIGTGFTNALRVMTDCTLINNFFNNVSLAEGNFTAPPVPASTVNYTNEFGYTSQVSIYGGTVTAIDLDDVATGLTSGIFIIPPGGTINITYSSVPTWAWWGL